MERSQGKHTTPSLPHSVPVTLEELLQKRIRKSPSLRAKALRALGGFLALMLLLTLLSRAADELTIPKVSLQTPEPRTIDRKITASGKVEETSASSVTAIAGLRVAGISVKTGERVEENAPLFTLDEEDLKEKLEAAREELTKLDLEIRDQESRDTLNAENRSIALSRAQQDLASAKKSADKAVNDAAKALENAQKALESYSPPPAAELSALQAACTAKEAALQEAENALSLLREEIEAQVSLAREAAETAGESPEEAERETRAEYQAALKEAEDKAAFAEKEKQEAQEALSLAQKEDGASQKQALREAVESARQAYDQAVENRESALRAAERAVEDARQREASDSTGERNQMARAAQAEQVAKLEALFSDHGVIRSPRAGTVTGLSVEVGSPTPEGTAVLLAESGQSTVFTAQVPVKQQKYVTPGTAASLKLSGGKEPLTGLTVDTVGQSAGDPELLDVTIRLPKDAMEIGETAELEILNKSQEYPICVPLSALRGETGAYFLLVPDEEQGILGTELVARRVDVTVLEKNDSYAALDSSLFFSDQKFLTSTSKPVGAGDRIRLENP